MQSPRIEIWPSSIESPGRERSNEPGLVKISRTVEELSAVKHSRHTWAVCLRRDYSRVRRVGRVFRVVHASGDLEPGRWVPGQVIRGILNIFGH